MDKKTKDLLTRAGFTFVQAFIPVFFAGLYDVLNAFQGGLGAGKAALLALSLSAVAAGLSALKTLYVQARA